MKLMYLLVVDYHRRPIILSTKMSLLVVKHHVVITSGSDFIEAEAMPPPADNL